MGLLLGFLCPAALNDRAKTLNQVVLLFILFKSVSAFCLHLQSLFASPAWLLITTLGIFGFYFHSLLRCIDKAYPARSFSFLSVIPSLDTSLLKTRMPITMFTCQKRNNTQVLFSSGSGNAGGFLPKPGHTPAGHHPLCPLSLTVPPPPTLHQ